MALDRQEAKAAIAALNVPSVTNATMNTMLQTDILDQVVLRKDEKSSASGVGLSTYTANFANDEQVILTGINQNIAISFSNLEDGDVRYLYITKGATNVVTFSGANDMVRFRYYHNNFSTSILYRVTSKNGSIYVEDIFSPVDSTWNSLTLAGSWSGNLKYRYNYFINKIELYFNCFTTLTTDQLVGTLPAGFRPANILYLSIPYNGIDTASYIAKLQVDTSGNITVIAPNPLVLYLTVFGLDGLADYYIYTP